MPRKPVTRLLVPGVIAALLIGGIVFRKDILAKLENISELSEATAFASSIALACRTFAADESGNYPPDLNALIPDYIDIDSLFVYEDDSPRWVYQPGLHANTDNDAVLFHSIRPINSLWVRAHVGGRVTVSKDLDDPEGRPVGKGGI